MIEIINDIKENLHDLKDNFFDWFSPMLGSGLGVSGVTSYATETSGVMVPTNYFSMLQMAMALIVFVGWCVMYRLKRKKLNHEIKNEIQQRFIGAFDLTEKMHKHDLINNDREGFDETLSLQIRLLIEENSTGITVKDFEKDAK